MFIVKVVDISEIYMYFMPYATLLYDDILFEKFCKINLNFTLYILSDFRQILP
jgi:hypothetical protein